MKTLARLIRLRPHGRNLCSANADVWLLLLRLNIFLILSAEGLGWGFIGTLMGADTSRWAGAVIVGGMIVLLVGSIDTAFALLDLSKIHQDPTSLNGSTSAREKVAAFFARYGNPARIGLIVRVGMVIGSLLITSPFLAQLMFSADIANLRKADYDNAVSLKQDRLLSEFDVKIKKIRAERDAEAAEHSREIAGKGLSGRYGVGPVARSLNERVVKLDQELADLDAQKRATLESFQKASPMERAQRFGVAMASDGIATRFEALGRMEQISGFRRAENAIRMILFGLFLGLLLLKWYEPRSLEIYLDDELQDAFLLYRRGYYDDWHDRSKFSPDQMTPFEFRRWYYTTEKVRSRSREIKEKMSAISARQTDIESTVRHLSGGPADDMAALTEARAVRAEALEAANKVVKDLEEQSSDLDAEIALCDQELQDAARTINNEPRFSASAVLLQKQRNWEDRRKKAQAAQRLHIERLKNATQFRDAKQEDVRSIDGLIAAQNAVMAELAIATAEARRAALRDLRNI